MKVVVDTNLMLVMLSEKSVDHDLFLALLNGEYEVCVTPDILLEYEEIIARKNGPAIASAAIELLVSLPNVHFINRYFHWNLITADPDDNKFVDCAIAADAQFLVSDDRHFQILKTVEFPKVEVIDKLQFREKLQL